MKHRGSRRITRDPNETVGGPNETKGVSIMKHRGSTRNIRDPNETLGV